MIVPSIDIMDGQAVQLIGGREKVIDAGDPRPIAERFAPVGEIAVIDLDAALGRGSNAEIIEELCRIAQCRVGGGIRDEETAVRWLDMGARKIILGTAASADLLSKLPRERVIAALDARNDRVVVEGWTKETTARVEDRIEELKRFVGGFLVTFVEREGRMGGLPADRVEEVVRRAAGCRMTVAGGVRGATDVEMADRAGADVQVGMSLYTGAMGLAEGFCAPLRSDRADGLWPTVVVDEHGAALGLVYSNLESVRAAIEERRGVYWSRSRGRLWRKGEESGNTQRLLRMDADCDRDALRFTVRQEGSGFCHTGTRSCFGEATGLVQLEQRIRSRLASAPAGSYVRRLLDDPALLRTKLIEECGELMQTVTPDEAAQEAADVVFFALTAAIQRGTSLEAIEAELDRRALGVTRRRGDAKPGAGA
ncbi:MAG: phosphoribosyl-ATP diphosphatase [Leptolyngbya sp. PLA3]|nr:MAG: phosphoribosyl-ATP diphosphatase [Cyanobacteria bacterium CYA]MCE7969280.1 phosphoribosyl-ATP diphosphatase [Leptolyngbya sp. PL-A3]